MLTTGMSIVSDRVFMVFLTVAVIAVIVGIWGMMVGTLHKIQYAADLLVSRTDLLEEHVMATTPEVFKGRGLDNGR